MDILLHREFHFSNCCIGKLRVENDFWCWTLEDPERQIKIQNETAIPCGRYEIVIDYSPHFNCDMIHILDVPNYVGIRVHYGNDASDTDGCVLVGMDADLENGRISRSREAYKELTEIVLMALQKEKVFIEITSSNQALT